MWRYTRPVCRSFVLREEILQRESDGGSKDCDSRAGGSGDERSSGIE